MRVLMASKALVVGAYQKKLEEIAAHPEVSHLTAVVPPTWQEPGGRMLQLERVHTRGYDLRVEPIAFNGNFHFFFWPRLGRALRAARPDVVHLDEEPYNLATVHGAVLARRQGARVVFFTWQNLLRRYPPPFSLFEQVVYRLASHALVGNAEAEQVLRAKGYRGPATLVPQFGFDPERFAPARTRPDRPFTIGFVGRLVEEKGVWVLFDALARLQSDWRLLLVGSGPLLEPLRAHADATGLAHRITWETAVPSVEMPDRLRRLDALVLPSLTRPNWKEQFGRILVEAMACAVPVVGSDSGEIPHVLDGAGLIVPEGNAAALAAALDRLASDPGLRAHLGERGRALFLGRYTHRLIAAETVTVYREVVGTTPVASHPFA